MKISKKRLMEIIQEEYVSQLKEQEQEQEEDAQLAATKQEFGNRLLELSKRVRNIQGLDSKEMQSLLEIVLELADLSVESSAGPALERIKKKISQMIGER